MVIPRSLWFAAFSISALSVFTSSFPKSCTYKAFVFCIFMYILFSLAHLSTSLRSSVNAWFKDCIIFQFELEDQVVSSAYMSIVDFWTWRGIWLTNKRKSTGPRNDSWGTPCFTVNCSDVVFPNEINCYLSDSKDLNQVTEEAVAP